MVRAHLLVALLAGAACAGPGRAPAPATGAGADGGATPTLEAGDAPAPGSRVASEEPDPATPTAVRLDLAASLHYAEILRDGGPACDLGGPAGHRCTLGGFRTGWGRSGEDDGVGWIELGRGRRATVRLPTDGPVGGRLEVRLDPAGADRLEVRVGGERVGLVPLSGEGWTTAALELPDGAPVPGHTPLELRLTGAARRGATPRVDWVRLVRAAEASEPAWPSARAADGRALLTIPAGTTVGYLVEVPGRARLDARVGLATDGTASLTVRALRENGERVDLESLEVTSGEPAALATSLEGLESGVVRLELEARGGDILLGDPVLLEPVEGGTPRPLPELRARNLVIYLIDTLRADHLTTYRPDTRVRSEALTRFAAGGAVFEAAQAQENWTKPSVATLLASLHPSTHNAKSAEAVLPADVVLVGELLQSHGFVTAGFIANGYVSDRFGFRQGWDSYRNYVRESRRNRASEVVDDAIGWLDQRPQGQPFFLYVHTIDPHVPYVPPARYRELYDPEPYNGPIVASRTAQLLADIKVGRLVPNERDRFRLEALYDGEITYGDDHLARFLAALEERGLAHDTLVWITSDHGEEFFDHGSVGHGHSLYQELLHVPLAVSMPGLVPEGARIPHVVGLVDVLPTSLELLGLEPHDEAEGRSLVPLLEGAPPHLYEAAFSEFLDGGRAARVGDLKVLVEGRRIRLFDLAEDPGENRDVSASRPLALRHALTVLSMHLGAARGPATGARRAAPRVRPRQETPLDPETLEQLRALGYML